MIQKQRSTNLFSKGPNCWCFRLFGSYGLSFNTQLSLLCESSNRQYINKQVWLCSSEILFIKMGPRLSVVCEPLTQGFNHIYIKWQSRAVRFRIFSSTKIMSHLTRVKIVNFQLKKFSTVSDHLLGLFIHSLIYSKNIECVQEFQHISDFISLAGTVSHGHTYLERSWKSNILHIKSKSKSRKNQE